MSQLLPLTNLPRLAEDLNAFYIPSFSSAPSLSSKKAKLSSQTQNESKASKKAKSKSKSKSGSSKDKDLDALPSWMETYESSSSEDESSGPKRSRERERTSALSTHASIHSVPSHTSQYTDLWLVVLGGSSVVLDDVWTRKILVGLHGTNGILSHMANNKRVRITDWLGGLVDKGGALGMLAMNGLFVLMTTYNL